MSSDRIRLSGIRALGRHGCLPEETTRPQPFEVDLDIELDLQPAALADDLAATLDYGIVIAAVVTLIETGRFSLLETLATAIATAVLEHELVAAVTVDLRKVRPPVPAHVNSVGVRLRRTRA